MGIFLKLRNLHIITHFRTVEPEYASTAGMFGAASIITGIFAGIGFSYLMPVIVSHPALSFDAPNWWPSFSPNIKFDYANL